MRICHVLPATDEGVVVKKKTENNEVNFQKRSLLAQIAAALSLGVSYKRISRVKTPEGVVVRAKNFNGEKIG